KDQRVWIIRTEEGLYALFAKCTHLGCTPRRLTAENKFKCPCHGSGFYKTGINFEGPAPSPLERLRITKAEDGQLLIDKGVKYLEYDMPFGMLMRNMHRWAAHGMVIAVWLHMFRVFLTGSYKPPREFNWVVGVLLLVLTLLLSFTGYLLPWDQLSIWAVTVGSNMGRATPILGHEGPGHELIPGLNNVYDARAFLFGGGEIGPHTLLRFYILPCLFIPLVAS